ncbi:MAG: glycosyltransferase [Actinomycetota bacterium]|nr:glycosyltransferase [Actinomycetota bacterium]
MIGDDVTVVVPTVDRVDLLRRCLRGLTGAQVLVVHDGNAGVEALLAELDVPGLRIEQRGVSAKRNAGWRAATSALVAFTDDDCEPAPGWVHALAAASAEADLVAGPVRPHPEDEATGLWARTVSAEQAGFYPGCNLLLRKELLERVDGFDEGLHGGEDTDLAWRVREAGGRAAWAADGVVWHAVRSVTFVEHLRSLPRWSGLALVARRHPQLRRELAYHRWFWKPSHPVSLLGLLGLALTPLTLWALLALAPLCVWRVKGYGRRAPQVVVNDLCETAVMVAGSVRHRALLL